MAWVQLDSVTLYSSGTEVGYVYFEYDDSSSGVSRPCRIRVGERSGYYFSVYFNDFTVDGNYIGQISVTQTSGTIWSGNLDGYCRITWACPWYSGTVGYLLDGTVPAATSAPTGLTITHVSNTWNSVTGTVHIDSYGVPSGDANRYVEFGVVDPTKTTYGSPYRYDISYATRDATITVTNGSRGGFEIKGCTKYKRGGFATNTQRSVQTIGSTLYYTPPAPGQLTYVESSTGVFDVEYTGVAANNQTTYDTASLTRSVRYREVGASTWTDVESSAAALITAVTQFTVTVPASKTYEIEAWMTYHGNQSEVSRVTVTNAANPVYLYASARGISKKVAKLYGPVNGQTKKIKKLYGSVGGVTKLIFEDNS